MENKIPVDKNFTKIWKKNKLIYRQCGYFLRKIEDEWYLVYDLRKTWSGRENEIKLNPNSFN